MDQVPFGTNDFAENPEPRVPCVLVLDVSGSMAGEPIRQLNEGLTTFKDELSADSLASKRVEAAIVTFGQEVTIACDFTTAEGLHPPTLKAAGMTPMGQAVNMALDMIEQRKQTYKTNGISYYRPWVFMITDGGPNDDGWQRAAERSTSEEKAKKCAFFAVGVEGAHFDTLKLFSPREPLKLKGLRFRDLFLWLSSSLKSVSHSNPQDEVPLTNPATPNGWATIA